MRQARGGAARDVAIDPRQVRIRLGRDRRLAAIGLLADAEEQRAEGLGLALGDARGGLVEEEHPWLVGEDAGDRTATGLWPSDKASRPTLLMNYSGGWANQTVAAGLDDLIQCVSATAGDYDNDGDVDLLGEGDLERARLHACVAWWLLEPSAALLRLNCRIGR